MKEDNTQFPNVTHYTKVDVQPGGMNIQHVENLYQADFLKALGMDLSSLASDSVRTVPSKPKYPFVTIPSLTDSIISKLLSYLQGKSPSQAKDVMKPIRAAQDAGVIRRITYNEMKEAFPDYCPNNKSSVSYYTKEDETPYIDEAFKNMVEEFKALK